MKRAIITASAGSAEGSHPPPVIRLGTMRPIARQVVKGGGSFSLFSSADKVTFMDLPALVNSSPKPLQNSLLACEGAPVKALGSVTPTSPRGRETVMASSGGRRGICSGTAGAGYGFNQSGKPASTGISAGVGGCVNL